MRSIYHTAATTAEELRTELLAELERRIISEEIYGAKTASTNKERAIVYGRIQLLRDLIHFWTDVIIDRAKDHEQSGISTTQNTDV